MALLDHCPAPDLPSVQPSSQTFDIPAITSRITWKSLESDCLPVVFPRIYKNAHRRQKSPWGWVTLKRFILYDWVTRCLQRLNHPNRITCGKAGRRSQSSQPGTGLTAPPGKAASRTASVRPGAWGMSTSGIFNSSSWVRLWADALRLRRPGCAVWWGCWISSRPGWAWGRRRSTFCVWGSTTAAKQPSSTSWNRLMWVRDHGWLRQSASDSFLTVCCQHSSLLGPFSEEWKHVSQVKT